MSGCHYYDKATLIPILLEIMIFLFGIAMTGCRSADCTGGVGQIRLSAFKGLSPTHEDCILQSIFPCQIRNFCADEDNWERSVADNMNKISFFILIENRSKFELRLGSEAYSIGYWCLELDFEVEGKLYTSCKKEGVVWYRNLPVDDVVPPGAMMLYPVVLDERIWSYTPPREIDEDMQWTYTPFRVRPRLKGVMMVNEGKLVRRGDVVGEWASIEGEISSLPSLTTIESNRLSGLYGASKDDGQHSLSTAQ